MSKETPQQPEAFKITFQPMGLSCSAPRGQTIMSAAAGRGIYLRSDCGGKGLCGKCVVEVTPPHHVSDLADSETRLLSSASVAKGGRLACAARIEGALSVAVMESDLDSREALGKSLTSTIRTKDRPRNRGDEGGSGALGVAIDIGTTTLALYLCDLQSRKILHCAADPNPQRRFGEDVISRIAYCSEHEDGVELLNRVIIDGINRLIDECLAAAAAPRETIGRVTVVGNTTMQHLFCGYHPGRLGVSPFMPESTDAADFSGGELGLRLPESCRVYLFPVVSGFVGGDTVGAILWEKPHLRDGYSLILDIGTNGEIVLGNRDSIWAASCATGPALEGAHIRCGMRASSGAIDTVRIDPECYQVEYTVIGGKQEVAPKGICGSGIIDLVAEMLRAGLIIPSGRLCEGLPGIVTDEKGIGREFVIVTGNESNDGTAIVMTLTDVRQVQLAKAALSTGIRLLMKKAGVSRVDRLVLTGAFGARFNWKNAAALGMLPESAGLADVSIVENGAGRGAVLALFDEEEKQEAERLARRAHLLELADDIDFAREFNLQIGFPESD